MEPSKLTREAGLSREAVYEALVPGGDPTLDTLARITKAMGLRLTVAPARGARVGG
jgi:probable addiction module antidote protein